MDSNWTNIDDLILRRNYHQPFTVLCKIFPNHSEEYLHLRIRRLGLRDDVAIEPQYKHIPSDYCAKNCQMEFHADCGFIDKIDKLKCDKGTYNCKRK